MQIQAEARSLTLELEAEARFSVHVFSWQDMCSRLSSHPDLVQKHFPQFFPPTDVVTAAASYRLPVPVSSFVGRQTLVERGIRNLVHEKVRLLTLIGTGGVGKTRLALEIGRSVEGEFANGAAFVDLSAVSDAEMVPSALMQALNVPDGRSLSQIDQLRSQLSEKNLLLLMDNFEQVVDAAPIVAQLLTASPQLTIVATSRSPLRIDGEVEFVVEPLNLPNLTSEQSYEELIENEAVDLFIQRAQAVRADFRPSAVSDVVTVAQICDRLDGIPLAIELAAVRIRVQLPSALLAQLDERLPHLIGNRRDAPARQRTMRDAINWSYELLDGDQRSLFRRLGVFTGGCSTEAAAKVLATDNQPIEYLLQQLEALVKTSLVHAEVDTAGSTRFDMLPTIREFARERLDESEGEESKAWRDYAIYFRDLARAHAEANSGIPQADWMALLEVEHSNLRTVLEWCVEQDETDILVQVVWLIWRFWTVRGFLSEGRFWIEKALSHSDNTEDFVRVGLLMGAAEMARGQRDYARASRYLTEVVEYWEQKGDFKMWAGSLLHVGSLEYDQERMPEATAAFEKAEALFKDISDESGMASVRIGLGTIALDRQQLDRAHELLDPACDVLRRLGSDGDEAALVGCLHDQVRLAQAEEDLPRALKYVQELAEIHERLGDTRGRAHSLITWSRLTHQMGDFRAQELRMESQRLSEQLGDKLHAAEAILERARFDKLLETKQRLTLIRQTLPILLGLGAVALIAQALEAYAALLRSDNPSLAVQLLASASRQRERTQNPMWPAELPYYQSVLKTLHSLLGKESFEKFWSVGRDRSAEDIIAEVIQMDMD